MNNIALAVPVRHHERVLIEREGELAALGGRLAGALSGRGAMVFVGGEAGIGKTTLLSAFVAGPAGRVRVRRGGADVISTADALAPLTEAVPEIAPMIDADAPRLTIFRRAAAVLGHEPTLLLLEDLHWADGATFDLLRFLGRRIADLPLLVVGTYRDDEVTARHPMSSVLGDLTSAPAVTRMPLAPLSAAGVQQLVEANGSAVDAQALYARSGGNAFFATELLAADDATLPPTVRDAVLARAARLSVAARDVLDAAAVLGRAAPVELLLTASARSEAAIDECVAGGVLVADGADVAFRHDLARLAVEEAIPPGERAAVHARALAALRERDPSDHAALTRHAIACGDWDSVFEHAPAAGARAARLGAHRQAAELFRVALRATHIPPQERAPLFEALAYECYIIEQTEEAVVARQQAMELYEIAGNVEGVGAAQRWLSRLSWFLGRNADAERYAQRAIATLEPLGDGHELAMAYSNLSQLRALSHDPAEAIEWGERALAIAARIDDREAQMHALNNTGTAMCPTGRFHEGRQRLHRSLELALADDAHEHAARAYTNLGYSCYELRELSEAERVLRSGIAYCEERDLDSWTRYMRATLVAVLTELGRFDDALGVADPLLAHPQLAPISRIPAAVNRSRIAAYRGQPDGGCLDAAEEAARLIGESQRLVPVAAARAEAAWLTGAPPSDIVAGVDIAWDLAVAHPDKWSLGELAWWLDRAGVSRPGIEPAEPFALMLDRQWAAAAAAWRELNSPVWTAIALGFDPDLDAARASFELLDSLGAPALWTALQRERRAAGLALPRGPRPSTRRNDGGLTAREIEVLQLLADGLSNAEVAERLFLSERTVAHHVSAVLRKLGETSRGRAVAAAQRLGLVSPA